MDTIETKCLANFHYFFTLTSNFVGGGRIRVLCAKGREDFGHLDLQGSRSVDCVECNVIY